MEEALAASIGDVPIQAPAVILTGRRSKPRGPGPGHCLSLEQTALGLLTGL